MSDYIIRATAANNQIRAFAAVTNEMAETSRKSHNTSPIATAALGRLLTAGAMMGAMMKGEKDILTLQVNGDGEMRGMTVTADANANVKGYAFNPDVMLPASPQGKLDVGKAVGKGTLRIIKDMGMKEPYTGHINLVSGEIAEDLTYYFAISEQIPSTVGLGVLMNKNNTVKHSGGFIIQLMPFAEESVIVKLEEKINNLPPVTDLLDKGMTPENILDAILGDQELEILDKIPTKFECNCSKERTKKAVISIGEKELVDIIKDGEAIEVNCHFCSTSYDFSIGELEEILESSRN